jgi:hypothetical protein
MDALLKELAGASMAVGAGEEALAEGATVTARDRLDEAAATLAALRGRWPGLGPAERTVVAKTAAPLRARLDAARARPAQGHRAHRRRPRAGPRGRDRPRALSPSPARARAPEPTSP